MRNLSYENEFDLYKNETVGETHFYKNGFALRLVLIQRQKATQKWRIKLHARLQRLSSKEMWTSWASRICFDQRNFFLRRELAGLTWLQVQLTGNVMNWSQWMTSSHLVSTAISISKSTFFCVISKTSNYAILRYRRDLSSETDGVSIALFYDI